MYKSDRTKQVIRRRNLFMILSFLTWITTALVMVFSAFSKFKGETPAEAVEHTELLSDAAKTLLTSLSITVIVGILASIIIKDKIRTFIWMVSVVLAALIYKSTGMYIVLGLWFVEEYVFHTLFKYYSTKVSINKEIDLRE